MRRFSLKFLSKEVYDIFKVIVVQFVGSFILLLVSLYSNYISRHCYGFVDIY